MNTAKMQTGVKPKETYAQLINRLNSWSQLNFSPMPLELQSNGGKLRNASGSKRAKRALRRMLELSSEQLDELREALQ
jgi:hypothetical protein